VGSEHDAPSADSLFALWWLIALRGLRRGEACGLRWTEVDLDNGLQFICRNRTTAGYQVVECAPKTAAGVRPVALDKHTVKVPREHRRRQADQRERRLAAGRIWHESGYVFVRADGSPIHPGYASGRFRLLVRHTDVPPIRLQDLRHGAASLAGTTRVATLLGTRYHHGKVVEWSSASNRAVVTGSANCTRAALSLAMTEPGGNCELALLREVPPVPAGLGRLP